MVVDVKRNKTPPGPFPLPLSVSTVDQVHIHSVNFDTCELDPLAPATLQPGDGPRHMTFYGDNAYLVTELSGTVVNFNVDINTGALTQKQQFSLRPPDANVAEVAPSEVRGAVFLGVRSMMETC